MMDVLVAIITELEERNKEFEFNYSFGLNILYNRVSCLGYIAIQDQFMPMRIMTIDLNDPNIDAIDEILRFLTQQ